MQAYVEEAAVWYSSEDPLSLEVEQLVAVTGAAGATIYDDCATSHEALVELGRKNASNARKALLPRLVAEFLPPGEEAGITTLAGMVKVCTSWGTFSAADGIEEGGMQAGMLPCLLMLVFLLRRHADALKNPITCMRALGRIKAVLRQYVTEASGHQRLQLSFLALYHAVSRILMLRVGKEIQDRGAEVPQAGILMRLLNSLLFEPLLMLAADAFLLGEHCPRFCPGIMNVHTATNTKVSPRMRDLMRQIHLLGDIDVDDILTSMTLPEVCSIGELAVLHRELFRWWRQTLDAGLRCIPFWNTKTLTIPGGGLPMAVFVSFQIINVDINICGHLTSLALLGGDTELADVAGGVVLTSVDLVRMTDRDKAMGVASSVAMDGAFAATIQGLSQQIEEVGASVDDLKKDFSSLKQNVSLLDSAVKTQRSQLGRLVGALSRVGDLPPEVRRVLTELCADGSLVAPEDPPTANTEAVAAPVASDSASSSRSGSECSGAGPATPAAQEAARAAVAEARRKAYKLHIGGAAAVPDLAKALPNMPGTTTKPPVAQSFAYGAMCLPKGPRQSQWGRLGLLPKVASKLARQLAGTSIK